MTYCIQFSMVLTFHPRDNEETKKINRSTGYSQIKV
jgi:hypothetical protein